MHTTWRATAAHLLLGAGTLLALGLAMGFASAGPGVGTRVAAWTAVGLLVAGLILSWLQHRESERFRRHLGYGLTHHLRTSLANVQAYNEMLLLGSEASEDERRDWLEVVGREAERVGAAVENLLLIINHRKKTSYPVRRAVDLGLLLEDVACGYGVAGECSLRFATRPPAGVRVDADPTALRHALSNLLESLGSGGRARLSAQLSSDGAKATLVVGVENGAIPALDDGGGTPFREADLEGATDVGFGLELAVVQHVARAHGGRAAPYREGDTSGYRIELPLSRD